MATASSDSDNLTRLAAMLSDPRMPVQQLVAVGAGVPQGLVSMAANLRLRRVTRRVRLLIEYSDNLLGAKGDAGLGSTIEGAPNDVTGSPSRDAVSAAEGALRRYLRDGYDPSVVIAQLDVLRRAQQVARPRRRGVG